MSIKNNREGVVKKGDKKTRKHITILIVEDDPSLLTVYKDFLKDKYTVETAKNKKEALNKISENINIVLLDRRLPEHKGSEVLEVMRENPKFDAKIAMLTGIAPNSDILDLPVDEYKTKPIDYSGMQDLVRTLLLQKKFELTSKRFFRLNSKRSALKEADKADTEAYNQVNQQVDKCLDNINTILDEINNDSIFRTFPK